MTILPTAPIVWGLVPPECLLSSVVWVGMFTIDYLRLEELSVYTGAVVGAR